MEEGEMVASTNAIGSSELQRLGVPLDGEELERMRTASLGLDIQIDDVFEPTIVDAEFGGTLLMIRAAIRNVSPRVMWLNQCRIELPWYEPEFSLLEDPRRKVPRESIYSSQREPSHLFDRKEVLNHRFGSQGRVNPDDFVEGLILGEGLLEIPYHYQDQQRVDVQLEICDGRGKLYPKKVCVMLRRSKRRMRLLEQIKSESRWNQRKRVPIFDKVAA
jgi:hypothetical protein